MEIGQIVEWYESIKPDDPFAPLVSYLGEISAINENSVEVMLLCNVKDTIIKTNKTIILPKTKVKEK